MHINYGGRQFDPKYAKEAKNKQKKQQHETLLSRRCAYRFRINNAVSVTFRFYVFFYASYP